MLQMDPEKCGKQPHVDVMFMFVNAADGLPDISFILA